MMLRVIRGIKMLKRAVRKSFEKLVLEQHLAQVQGTRRHA